MKRENGKIVEATEKELLKEFYDHEWGEVFDFGDFLLMCMRKGIKIIKEDGNADITDHEGVV